MYRIMLFVLALGVLRSAVAQSEPGPASVKDITPRELFDMLENAFVIDVNEDFTYAEAHVPGSKLMAYDAIAVDQLPTDKSTKLAFYCWSPECPAAGMAAKAALDLGYTNVYCMPAGITGWQDAGLRTEP